MTQSLYERAAELLEELLGSPPDQRLRRLDEVPGLCPELRAEVASLLAHHRDDAFLAPESLEHALERTVASRAHAPVPESIGGYPVVRRIGVGGMGSVYEVKQGSVGRRAALKVMHDLLVDEHSRLRFQLEIDALARLNHPGVAQIFDAGIDHSGGAPVPFFVMELVDGEPLDRRSAKGERTIDEVLALFGRLCDAVEHAHQRGILHRDLKPGNVLVDAADRVKVLDFGIARPTEQHRSLVPVTGDSGALVGTLAYMSPEQCSLEKGAIDVRTDVYSLGALLYELLVGRPPIEVEGAGLVGAARRICEVPPARPLRAGRPLHRDLEAIVLRALEKRPDARYQSVSGLSEDLRRFRAGLPVHARAPSSWSKLLAWGRRRPLLAASLGSAVLAGSILTLTALAIWWIGFRPSRVVIEPGTRDARLLSLADHELHRWKGPVVETAVVERHADLGGGRVAVLAFLDARQVCAHAFDDPAPVLWSTATLDRTPPGPLPSRSVHPVADLLTSADYLPELPGDEVLVVERLSPHSPAAIRVLDLAGEVRYEVWHEGGITGASWHADRRRLVLSGFHSGATWIRRGSAFEHHMWPYVVFALDVRDGRHAVDDYLTGPGGRDSSLAWYSWVGPLESLRAMTACRPRVDPFTMPDGQLVSRLTLTSYEEGEYGDEFVALVVDAEGVEVDRIVSDHYHAAHARGEAPDADSWRLLPFDELPPDSVAGER